MKMKIKSLILMAMLVVSVPAMSLACSLVAGCPVTYIHTHQTQPQPQIVVVQQAPQQVIVQRRPDFMGMLGDMVYISSGVTSIISDYHRIHRMSDRSHGSYYNRGRHSNRSYRGNHKPYYNNRRNERQHRRW